MLDVTAKTTLRTVMKMLDEQSDVLDNLIVDAMLDRTVTFTDAHAISALEDVLHDLTLRIGQTIESLKGVTPPAEVEQPSNVVSLSL